MAQKGFMLKGVSIGYQFSTSSPEDKTIRIDYRHFKNQEEFLSYCTLFDDSGWRHIAGTRRSGTQYFERKNETCSDSIFSDAISEAGRYERVAKMWMSLAITYIPVMIALLMTNSLELQSLMNPKALYFTPGLWEREGISFWFGFLFETPFVLLRNFFWIPIILCIVLYILFALKSWRLYKKGPSSDRAD